MISAEAPSRSEGAEAKIPEASTASLDDFGGGSVA
jgi:hypothetical protein